MDNNFSPRVKDVISFSKEEALRLGHEFIGTEHFILGILKEGDGKAFNILQEIVDINYLHKKIESLNPYSEKAVLDTEKKNLHLTRQADRALKMSFLEAKHLGNTSISTGHLLLCILRNENIGTNYAVDKKLPIDSSRFFVEGIKFPDSELTKHYGTNFPYVLIVR